MGRKLLVGVVSTFTVLVGMTFTTNYVNAWAVRHIGLHWLAVIAAGVAPLGAGLIGFIYPRLASRILLLSAIPAFVSVYVTFSLGPAVGCAVAEMIPGLLLWYSARNRQDAVILLRTRKAEMTARGLTATAFVLMLALATALPLTRPWWPIGDCGPVPFFINGHPQHLAFTAEIVKIGLRDPRQSELSLWAIARIEHTYTPVAHFPLNYVILRGSFSKDDRGVLFLVDGRRSNGLFYRLLPIIEPVVCGSSSPARNPKAELRLLDNPTSPSGVRIIGAVYRHAVTSGVPEKHIKVHVESGTTRRDLVTDSDGVFDVSGLPPANYTIWPENDYFQKWSSCLKEGDAPVLNFWTE